MEGDILARFDVPSQADYANSGRPVYTVFRYEDVMKVLRDPENWHSSLNADGFGAAVDNLLMTARSEEHTSELQSLMRISYAVFCLKKKKINDVHNNNNY